MGPWRKAGRLGFFRAIPGCVQPEGVAERLRVGDRRRTSPPQNTACSQGAPPTVTPPTAPLKPFLIPMRLRDMSLMAHGARIIRKVGIVEGSPLELLKGTLDTLILKTLSRGPNHGYGIARWLRESSADAFQVEEGALYPALRRLEKRGFLISGWDVTETGREAKFYRLTEDGRAELEAALAHWSRYVSAMGQVLDSGGRA